MKRLLFAVTAAGLIAIFFSGPSFAVPPEAVVCEWYPTSYASEGPHTGGVRVCLYYSTFSCTECCVEISPGQWYCHVS